MKPHREAQSSHDARDLGRTTTRCRRFPKKRDGRGRDHVIFEPLDDATRLDLTSQIFEHLGLERCA